MLIVCQSDLKKNKQTNKTKQKKKLKMSFYSEIFIKHMKRYIYVQGRVLIRNLPVGTDKEVVPLPLV